MARRVGGLEIAVLLIALASVACRQLVGITDNPPTDLVANICGLPYGTSACASCVQAKCCAESMACAADPTCTAYESCLGKCTGDPKCRSQCTTYPVSTASDVSALSACLASSCETACGLTCGGVANLVAEPPSAASCQSCIEATPTTCAHARAWGTSAGGDTYWRCVMACPTEDCRETCATDNDAGAATFGPFQTDYAGSCSGPCAYGKYWACVGHVSWPAAMSRTVLDTFSIVDYSSRKAVPGLDVAYCTVCPCGTASSPTLADAATDDAGTFHLALAQVVDNHQIGLNGCHQVTSPSMTTIPEFMYAGYPLSEPTVTLPGPAFVVTPDELSGLLSAINVVQSPELGWVVVAVDDCLGSPAPGVHVTVNGGNDTRMTAVYFSEGVASGAPGSEVESTTSSGLVAFYNVSPGLVTLTATPEVLGKPSGQFTISVAPGTLTVPVLWPTPSP